MSLPWETWVSTGHKSASARHSASLAAASFAVQPLLVKLAFDGGASVVSVGALRFALAAAVLAVLARRTLAVTSLRILLPPFVLGLTLYGLETGLFFASLERIDVSLASLLMCSYPAIVVAGAVLLGRERASKRRVAALVVALAGVLLALAGGVGGALDPVGIALALAASVIYASYVLVSDRLLGTTEPLVLATMLCAGAATAFALGGAATGSLAVALPPTDAAPGCGDRASLRPCSRSPPSSAACAASARPARRSSARSSRRSRSASRRSSSASG